MGDIRRPNMCGPKNSFNTSNQASRGGGHVQRALVSSSIGNGPLCPETKSTHTLHIRGERWHLFIYCAALQCMICRTRALQISDYFSILCCQGMENLGLHEEELTN